MLVAVAHGPRLIILRGAATGLPGRDPNHPICARSPGAAAGPIKLRQGFASKIPRARFAADIAAGHPA